MNEFVSNLMCYENLALMYLVTKEDYIEYRDQKEFRCIGYI